MHLTKFGQLGRLEIAIEHLKVLQLTEVQEKKKIARRLWFRGTNDDGTNDGISSGEERHWTKF
jgi:hypothetical protein